MIQQLECILFNLIEPEEKESTLFNFDLLQHFNEKPTDNGSVARALNAAFLINLSGSMHPAFERAKGFLVRMGESSEWEDVAKFYTYGIEAVRGEVESLCKHAPNFADRLKTLLEWTSNEKNLNNLEKTAEKMWSVFCPEASGIRGNEQECIKALRGKRTVAITKLNPSPITNPAGQILFTSNILLTIPPASKSPDELHLNDRLKEELLEITREPQLYWYDHPIQAGVEPGKNEVLYGLRGLEAALEFERDRGNMKHDAKPVCILSVSVTHGGLQKIAKRYLEEELVLSGGIKNMDIFVFTEEDTQTIIDEILAPAALHYLNHENGRESLNVFGVDGAYGRHYSFLKAIAAFWATFVQPEIRATFKIDLDQVFPQKELVEETGSSAFEHFQTPLWGAHGLDSNGQALRLGMIAGALVNEQDTRKSLFTPDVPFPELALSPDEYVFFSTLPQALSTEAEMMTRYNKDVLDGKRKCIQRIHVTGGTNGILIDSLRRYRPFTPSFMGRAEDQAYILSVLCNPGTKLAYIHKDGLYMRHDKEGFGQEAIQSAFIGKLVGDYARIIYFSAYAKALTDDLENLKQTIDPFTGSFVSRIPKTVVYLRFSLKAASFFASGKEEQGLEFIKVGAKRIMKALDFANGEKSMLTQLFKKERLGWGIYYDTLSASERALKNGDGFALELRKKAKRIIDLCSIRMG